MKSLKRVGAELILGTIVLPWIAWVTIAVFDSKTANAIQETKYQYIAEKLNEISADIKEVKKK